MISPVRAFLDRRRANFALLRRALEVVGPEFERRPYDELTIRAEELSFARVFEGVSIAFSAEAYGREKNGDLSFCIDADGPPTFPFPGPSWNFYKRKDGSVYY